MATENDDLKSAAIFLGGLIEILNVPRMSYMALGVWCRIADDDNKCLTPRAIAERSHVEDEKAVLVALRELERAGFVRMDRVQESDGTWTTRAWAIAPGA